LCHNSCQVHFLLGCTVHFGTSHCVQQQRVFHFEVSTSAGASCCKLKQSDSCQIYIVQLRVTLKSNAFISTETKQLASVLVEFSVITDYHNERRTSFKSSQVFIQ